MATTNLAGGQSTSLDDLTDLTRADYVAAFKRTLAEIKRDDVPGLAAGVAFKIFLALFPALFAAVAIFTIVTTVAELREWLAQAEGFLPREALDLVEQNLTQGKGGGAGFAAVTGVLAGLWAATSAAASLMKALSRAYDVEETRKFVRQRLVALALTVALLVALVGVIVLLVLGPQLQSFLLGEIVAPVTWGLAAVRLVLAFGVLVLLFAFVYWIGPNRDHPSWLWMSPGSLLGVIGWLLVSGGFTLYAQTAGNYNETYGAIAGVIVLLVWLQLSMLVILVGAEFNAEVERARALRLAVADSSGFAAPGATGGIAPDSEDGAAALHQAQIGAHTVDPQPADPDATVDLAPPVLAEPVPAPPSDEGQRSGLADATAAVTAEGRKAAAAVGTVMAIAVFLGFARRRKRG
jgi:membrane protein